MVERRYLWESKIANDGSLLFYGEMMSILKEHCVNCFKVYLEEIGYFVEIKSVRNK